MHLVVIEDLVVDLVGERLLRRAGAGRRERRDDDVDRHARHGLAGRRIDLLVDARKRHLARLLAVHGNDNYRTVLGLYSKIEQCHAYFLLNFARDRRIVLRNVYQCAHHLK